MYSFFLAVFDVMFFTDEVMKDGEFKCCYEMVDCLIAEPDVTVVLMKGFLTAVDVFALTFGVKAVFVAHVEFTSSTLMTLRR
jgi:hypothetical protein